MVVDNGFSNPRDRSVYWNCKLRPTRKTKINHHFIRFLFASAYIKKGEVFIEQNIKLVRPNEGCSPKYLPVLLGQPSDRDYKFGDPIV